MSIKDDKIKAQNSIVLLRIKNVAQSILKDITNRSDIADIKSDEVGLKAMFNIINYTIANKIRDKVISK